MTERLQPTLKDRVLTDAFLAILTGVVVAGASVATKDTMLKDPVAVQSLRFMAEHVWNNVGIGGAVPVIALSTGFFGMLAGVSAAEFLQTAHYSRK